MRKVFFYLMPLMVITACQKVVDPENLVDIEERVSIIGFLSPSDTLLRINVSRALPAVGTPLAANDFDARRRAFLITDAAVIISDEENNSVMLTFSDSLETYIADPISLAIRAGNTYFLRVTVGDREFNASCRIPQPVPEIEENINFSRDEFGNDITAINLGFTDFIEENNFYIVDGSSEITFQFEGEEPQTFNDLLFFDPDNFLTDNLNNGGMLNRMGEGRLFNTANLTNINYTLRVAHVEESIFQNARAEENNLNNEDNPFIEFSIAPNTILDTGAIGIFAGYSVTEKRVSVPLPGN